MKKTTCTALIAATLVLGASPASARELAVLTRIDDRTVELTREDTAPVTVWISADTLLDKGDTRFAAASKDGKLTLPIPVTERRYVILEVRVRTALSSQSACSRFSRAATSATSAAMSPRAARR